MCDAVISAWLHEVDALTPSPAKRSASSAFESLQRHKRRRRALAEHTVNVQRMAPQSPPTLPSDRPPKKSRRTPSPAKRGYDDFEADQLNRANEQTPRARQDITIRPSIKVPAAFLNTTYVDTLREQASEQAPAAATSASSQSNVSEPPRSSSPVKKSVALRDVGDGIYYAPLDDEGNELGENSLGMGLFQRIDHVRRGVGVVPLAVLQDAELRRRSGLKRFSSYAADTSDERGREDVLQELEVAQRVVRESGRCTLENAQEPEWNSAVHGPILRSVLGSTGHVGVRYITAAKIERQWLPPHSTGSNVAGKLVDFAIVLELQHPAKPLPAASSSSTAVAEERDIFASLSARIKSLLGTSPSINHTADPSLSHYPLAISIETKTAKRTEDEAKVQLAIWVAAQLARLRTLVGDLCVQEACPYPVSDRAEVSSPAAAPPLKDRTAALDKRVALLGNLTIPLLYVTHSRWSIFYARPSPVPPYNAIQDTRLYIYGPCDVGDTNTVLGTYRLIRVLRAIGQWVQEDFATWWSDFVAV